MKRKLIEIGENIFWNIKWFVRDLPELVTVCAWGLCYFGVLVGGFMVVMGVIFFANSWNEPANASLYAQAIKDNQFTLGIECTFFGGLMSYVGMVLSKVFKANLNKG